MVRSRCVQKRGRCSVRTGCGKKRKNHEAQEQLTCQYNILRYNGPRAWVTDRADRAD